MVIIYNALSLIGGTLYKFKAEKGKIIAHIANMVVTGLKKYLSLLKNPHTAIRAQIKETKNIILVYHLI